MSVRPDNARELSVFIAPFLETSVSLAEVYSDVSEMVSLILELFSLVAENFIVFLSQVSLVQSL